MKCRDRRGFTIIELITAMALLAVLAAIAWSRYNGVHQKALKATLVTDIRNLATAEEIYYRSHSTYTTNLPLLGITPSSRSQIYIITADPGGWSAWNEISGTPERCELYVGKNHSAVLGYATTSERIGCGIP